MASRTLKRSSGEEEIVATQALDLSKAFDAKYLRNVVGVGRMQDQRPWKWYRSIGEIHYAVSRGAKIAGYATITARKLDKEGKPGDIITSGPEADIAASLSSPYGGKRALIDRFFTLMKIPGDCYLIKCMDGSEHVGYDFIGSSEISSNDTSGGSLGQDSDAVFRPGSKIHRITLPAAGSTTGEELSIEIAAENFLGRVWRPSNQFVDMADSPMRALDVECEQLHLLTLGIKAKLLNRLALNGIFFIPQGMNDIKTGIPDGKSNPAVHENKVMDALIKAATFAVQNPESAEAAIPIFMSGDLAMGEAIRHIVFDREIYKVDMDLRHELITRLLMGLDVQPQHVKGLGDSSHWSAWAVSDDERRINIQPDMETLCWALTRLVLYREMKILQATNSKITDARISKTCLWYDLTEANVKTNLAEDARQAQDRIIIGPPAARRLTGLSESDAPTELEAIRMIGLKQGDAYLATYGMAEAKNFDWTKIGSHSGGPDPASPADNPTQVGPGVGSPGAPGKSESDTPRKLRPA